MTFGSFASRPAQTRSFTRQLAKTLFKSSKSLLVLHLAICAVVSLSFASMASAAVDPLPAPLLVPGKTISDWTNTGDQQSDATQNPHMTRTWKGDGTNKDSLDYTNSLAAFQPLVGELEDVDALANSRDLFFKELVNDYSTLLVSPDGLQNAAGGGLNEIYYRTSSPFLSQSGVWAKNFFDIGVANPAGTNVPPEGIDGLEVWGASDDHNMFSLYGDPPNPNDPLLQGVSVFIHDAVLDVSTPYIFNDDIRTAIGLIPGELEIDVDGLLVFDDLGDGVFGIDDSVIFTVKENQTAGGPFHGGEIWVWDFGSPANFLNHGGTIWDTMNKPGLIFNWFDPGGQVINEINALETIFAIPEPSGILLLSICMLVAAGTRRHQP